MSNLFKKVTSTVSVLAIAASAMGATASVSAASEFLTYADMLAKAGVINSQTEAGYRLGDNITRAEVAKIAVKLSGVEMYDCVGDVFSDVGPSLGDLCSAIETAAAEGFVNANADKFRPTDKVTRAEMVKMLLAANGVESSDKASSFKDIASIGDLAGYINAGVEIGAIKDGEYFRPNANATRGEAFKVASVVQDSVETTTPPTNGTGTTTPPTTSTGTTSTGVVTAGGLTISTTEGTVVTVPQKGTVVVGKINFAAASSDVTVSKIVLKRGGLGSRNDISNVWLEYNGKRVTTQGSVNSDETTTLSFTPAWKIMAGTAGSLDLVVKLDGTTSGGQHNFAIVAAKDVSSTASTLTAAFPVVSNMIVTSNYEVASLSYDPVSATTREVKAGEKNVILGEFKVSRSGVSTSREISVQRVAFDTNGEFDAAKNLANVAVYDKATGAKVSTESMFDGQKAIFTLNDSIAGTLSTRTYQIRADIANVDRASETLYFTFDSDEDSVIAIESSSGYRVNTKAVSTSLNLATVTIKAGTISMTTVGSTSNVDVAAGANDVVLLNGKITAREGVQLRDLKVEVDTTSTTVAQYKKALSTIRVVVGGQTVAFDSADLTASGTYTIKNYFVVDAGESPLKITADVRADALNANPTTLTSLGLKVKSVTPASFINGARYTTTNKSVPSTEFYGSVNSSTVTVKGSTVSISNLSEADASAVKGARNISLVKYQFTNSKVNTVRVSGEKFNVALTTSTGANESSDNYAVLQNVTVDMYVNGVNRGSQAIKIGTSGTSASVEFSGVDFDIEKSSKVTVELKAQELPQLSSSIIRATRDNTAGSITDSNSDPVTVSQTLTGTKITLTTASLLVSVATKDGKDILTTGSTQELAVLTFNAKNDDVRLTDLVIPFATGSESLISDITLVDGAGNVIPATTSVTNSGITVSDASYTIARNTRADVTIKAVARALSTTVTARQVQLDTTAMTVKAEGTVDAVSAFTLPTADTATDLISGGKLVVATKAVKSTTLGQFLYTITNNGVSDVNLTSVKLSGTTAGKVKLYKNETVSDDNRLDATTAAATGSTLGSNNTLVRSFEIAAGQTVTILVDLDLDAQMSATEETTYNLTFADLGYAEFIDGVFSSSEDVSSISQFRLTGIPSDSSIKVAPTSTLQ